MHRHRNGAPSEPGTLAFQAQREVLLEIVVTPPLFGDSLDYLARSLPVPPHAIAPAVTSLEAVGLVRRRGHVVFATPAALRFEHLWPVRL